GSGSELNANNVDITTWGDVGDGGWAYDGATLNITGGSITVHGGKNENEPGELGNGLLAAGGTGASNRGVINATGLTIVTRGDDSIGLLAGALVGSSRTSGEINFTNGSVTVNGEG